MTQRRIDLSLSVVATIVAFLVSWPYWRTFEYWAESRTAWRVYFVLGFLLGVYVFYVFIHSLHALFVHDAPGHGHDAEADS